MKKQMLPVILPAACLCAAAYLAVPAAAEDDSAVQTGWQEENGKRYYYDADGKKAVGEVTIDEITYLFAPNGALQVGWQTVNDKRFYYNKSGEAVFGWIEWRGENYYVSRERGKLTGTAETDEGKTCQFDEYGVCGRWIELDDGTWSYLHASGEMQIDGQPYLFTEEGILKTGWQTAEDQITRYYDAETHEIKSGWITETDGKRFYSDPEKGKLTGWITDNTGTRYYIDAEKGRLSGWQVIEGAQYKLLDDGTVYTGYYTVNGKTYLFLPDGPMVTGFRKDEEGTRFFAQNGVMAVGLTEIDGSTYYFDANGLMQTGEQTVTNTDGTVSRLKFGEDGKLIGNVSGWQTEGGVKHYINPDGSMATAPTVIDGKTYLFNAEGQLVSGLYTAPNGSKYYGNAEGVAQTGWQELPTQSSYFNANGTMAVSTNVDGYTIDANGSARNNRAVVADTIINASDKSIYGVYQSFCSRYYYKEIEFARTTDQLLDAGWDTLIDTMIRKNGGVCYNLAASLDFTFKRAGFTSRVIYAWHGSHHYWVQVLIDGFWWNYDPTYGLARCHITLAQQSQFDINRGGTGYEERGYVDAAYDHKGALLSAKFTPAG